MSQENLTQDINETFSKIAKKYDENHHFLLGAHELVRLVENHQTLHGKTPQKILDLSTGTGNIAINLALKYPSAQIVALDISSEMLDVAREKALEQNLSNISFVCADATTFDFGKEQFDVVTCGYALFFYPNSSEVFLAICRGLKSGGVFVGSTFCEEAFSPWVGIFLDLLKERFDISFPSELAKNAFDTKEQLFALAQNAPLVDFAVDFFEIKYTVTADKWWDMLTSTGYSGLLGGLSASEVAQFREDYLGCVVGEEGIEVNANTLYAVARN